MSCSNRFMEFITERELPFISSICAYRNISSEKSHNLGKGGLSDILSLPSVSMTSSCSGCLFLMKSLHKLFAVG